MVVKQKTFLWLGGASLLVLGLLLGLLLASTISQPTPLRSETPKPTPKSIVIAGDIACDAGATKTIFSCHQDETAALINALEPDAVLLAGDVQYPNGTLASFQSSYDKTWGAFKDITYPVPGNHEYLTPGASGYFDYFGDRAGERDKGYYAFSIGDWRLIALNSEVDVSAGSPQLTWLKQELETNQAACTLAYWHKPRFSTGSHTSDPTYDALWRMLYEHDADIVVNGHSHAYERFAAQNPDGVADAERGIVQFVSGMGGRSTGPLNNSVETLVTRQNHSFGVLKLSLYPKTAKYEFVPAGTLQLYSDHGSISCH